MVSLWFFCEFYLKSPPPNNQVRNFIFQRARPFVFCQGHFHWKMLKSMGNFWRGTKAKTWASEAMTSLKFQARTITLLTLHSLVLLYLSFHSQSSWTPRTSFLLYSSYLTFDFQGSSQRPVTSLGNSASRPSYCENCPSHSGRRQNQEMPFHSDPGKVKSTKIIINNDIGAFLVFKWSSALMSRVRVPVLPSISTNFF